MSSTLIAPPPGPVTSLVDFSRQRSGFLLVSHRRCAPTSGIENSSYRNYIPVGLDTHKRTRHVPGGEAKRARCDRAESIAPKVVVITITRLALLMRSARLDGCIGDVSSPRQADFRYRLAEPPPPLVWNALLVANIPRITDRSRLRRRHLDTCPQPPLISPPSIRNSGGPWNMGCSRKTARPGHRFWSSLAQDPERRTPSRTGSPTSSSMVPIPAGSC